MAATKPDQTVKTVKTVLFGERLVFKISLRDIKWRPEQACQVGQKWSYCFSFCLLSGACTRTNIYLNVLEL